MIPFISTSAALAPVQVHKREPQPTQLSAFANTGATPWLYSALGQIRDIEENHNRLVLGIGDFRDVGETAKTTRQLLSLVDMVDLPVPLVSPVSGGAMSITWSMGAREVKFSLFPDRQALFYRYMDDEPIDDGGVVNLGDPNSARDPLKWMINPTT